MMKIPLNFSIALLIVMMVMIHTNPNHAIRTTSKDVIQCTMCIECDDPCRPLPTPSPPPPVVECPPPPAPPPPVVECPPPPALPPPVVECPPPPAPPKLPPPVLVPVPMPPCVDMTCLPPPIILPTPMLPPVMPYSPPPPAVYPVPDELTPPSSAFRLGFDRSVVTSFSVLLGCFINIMLV